MRHSVPETPSTPAPVIRNLRSQLDALFDDLGHALPPLATLTERVLRLRRLLEQLERERVQ